MFDLNTRSVTFNLLMVNILVYVIAQIKLEFMYSHFSLFYPANPQFMPVQLISHMFMHSPMVGGIGIFHIAFNMFGLVTLGYMLERVWGPHRFFFFYFFTGLGAVSLHLIAQGVLINSATGSFAPSYETALQFPNIYGEYFGATMGASGAIFGIFAAFALLFPNTEMMLMFIPVPIKAKYLIGVYMLIELYFGFAMYKGDSIAHFAHLGGALFAFILVKYWNRNRHSLY